jgi:hypothetical protein
MSAPGETFVEPRPEGGGGARVLESDTRWLAPFKRCKEPET